MEILLQRNKLTDTILSPQQYTDGEGDNNRLCRYVQTAETDNGVLLYHLMTGELVFVHDIADEQETLFKKYYLVPNVHDDYKLYEQFTRLYNALSLQNIKTINSFTILTTTDCNARCFYCYEKGTKREKMSLETAQQVVKYIHANADASKPVHLWWLGGEPLYNSAVIDSICNDLTDANINFYSTMTSNGYLFDKELIIKAKEKWRLNKVQITLDGTEEIYNQRKAYIYENKISPFKRIINNIKLLSENGIKVHIRLNFDNSNSGDIISLVSELGGTFTEKENLLIYCHELFQCSENENISKIKDNINRKIKECGFNNKRQLKLGMKTNSCMADSMNSIVIMPDGSLQACTQYMGIAPFGNIWNNDNKKKTVSYYRERIIEENCKSCPALPICIKLKNCPHVQHGCSSEFLNQKLTDVREAMLQFIKKSAGDNG